MFKKTISNFIGFKRNKDKTIPCPECKGRMDVTDIVIDSESIPDYYEIRRKYKCRKCRHGCSSIELLAINGEVQSIADDLNKLYNSIDTLNVSIKTLLKAAHKLQEVKESVVYKGPVMN
jgi:transcriptional regulator NrdR family protein